MEERKSGIVWGILLIALGGFLLITRLMPGVFGPDFWPFIIIGVGGIFLLGALLTRTGGLAIPGCIIAGVGGILYYQNITSNFASWTYMWALIPGFVGVGILLAGLISRDGPRFEPASLVLMLISAVGFSVFGGFFGIDQNIDTLWPLFLIGAGIIVLFSAFFQRK